MFQTPSSPVQANMPLGTVILGDPRVSCLASWYLDNELKLEVKPQSLSQVPQGHKVEIQTEPTDHNSKGLMKGPEGIPQRREIIIAFISSLNSPSSGGKVGSESQGRGTEVPGIPMWDSHSLVVHLHLGFPEREWVRLICYHRNTSLEPSPQGYLLFGSHGSSRFKPPWSGEQPTSFPLESILHEWWKQSKTSYVHFYQKWDFIGLSFSLPSKPP